MHILHILNHVRKTGNGIVNVAVDLACLQAAAGHQVAIASVGGDYEGLLESHGVRHFQLNQLRQPINLVKAAWHYRAIVKDFQPDVVHAHMLTGLMFAKGLRANFDYGLVSTAHCEFRASEVLMGWADRVIAVSHAVSQSMVKRGVLQKKLRVVTNGTLGSPRTRSLKDYQPMLLEQPAIVTVAGLYERKGIAELIEAFAQVALDFSNAHLYIVGKGPDQAKFEAQAQQTAIAQQIHFEGFQPEPQRYLLASDIFVLASHRDPSPLVIAEAREAGCAIIASDVDGIPEALNEGQAGILVPPGDSSALATALKQLLGNSNLLQTWKDQANQNLEMLTASRVHEQTLAVYRELVPEI
jgi:glycosyltransferase involved in cell wall biosynthesis